MKTSLWTLKTFFFFFFYIHLPVKLQIWARWHLIGYEKWRLCLISSTELNTSGWSISNYDQHWPFTEHFLSICQLFNVDKLIQNHPKSSSAVQTKRNPCSLWPFELMNGSLSFFCQCPTASICQLHWALTLVWKSDLVCYIYSKDMDDTIMAFSSAAALFIWVDSYTFIIFLSSSKRDS